MDLVDISEEERSTVVREFTKVISNEIRESKKSISQLFQAKESKLFSNEFITGLKMLGIQNFDKNILLIFIESLQHEDEEEEL